MIVMKIISPTTVTSLFVDFEFIFGDLTVVTLTMPFSDPFLVELKQEAFLAQNVHAPVRLEQAVQFVGQTVHTPDELMY